MFSKSLLIHAKFYFLLESWDAMLKITGVKLEKTSDIDKYLFIEKGLKGGNSHIAKRYVDANNKYMKYYDAIKPSKFIVK